MERQKFDEICVYIGSIWGGREMAYAQRAAGWKLLANLPESAVEKAVDAIATDGREHMPPWPLVYKTANAIAQAEREALPQLPTSDALTDVEHTGVLLELRAGENPEQRRRADRMTGETHGLPMKVRLALAGKLLRGDGGAAKLPAHTWDALFDDEIEAAFREHSPLVPREVRI
jgi:hypothetical protein